MVVAVVVVVVGKGKQGSTFNVVSSWCRAWRRIAYIIRTKFLKISSHTTIEITSSIRKDKG